MRQIPVLLLVWCYSLAMHGSPDIGLNSEVCVIRILSISWDMANALY